MAAGGGPAGGWAPRSSGSLGTRLPEVGRPAWARPGASEIAGRRCGAVLHKRDGALPHLHCSPAYWTVPPACIAGLSIPLRPAPALHRSQASVARLVARGLCPPSPRRVCERQGTVRPPRHADQGHRCPPSSSPFTRSTGRSTPGAGGSRETVLRPVGGIRPNRGFTPFGSIELHCRNEAFGPAEAELPGQRKKFALLLTAGFGNAVAVNTWNTYIWNPALAKAGVILPRTDGVKAWQWAATSKDGFQCSGTPTPRYVGSRGVRRNADQVALPLLTGDHPRLLCSLHAGSRQQGARHHRRSAGGAGRPALRPKLPRFSPAPLT